MSGSIVLVVAILGSLAAGVLVAYGICQMMFTLFRMHARTVMSAKTPGKVLPQIAQS